MRKLAAFACLIPLAAATTAHAAQPEPPPPEPPPDPPVEGDPPAAPGPEEIQVVVTGTRVAEPAARAPIKTDVVTRKEAERRGATNVGEALSGELGVQVNPSAYGSIGGPSAIQIQGFDRERVLVLEDGERIIGDVGGAVDLASVPLADVSRIEIVAGPTSALYGASAVGGVVNVLTEPPLLEGPSGDLTVEGRAPRWGFITRGGASYRAEDNWVRVDGGLSLQDGVLLREGAEDLALASERRTMAGLRAGTRLTDEIDLEGRVRWIRDAKLGRESQVVPVLGTYVVDLPEDDDRIAARVIETIHLGEDSSLKMSASRQWYDGKAVRDRVDSPVDETRDRDYTLTAFETTASFVERSELSPLVGGRVEVERFDQELERVLVSSQGSTVERLTEVEPTQLGSAALYAQVRWSPTPSLVILPGARFEGHARFGAVVVPRLAVSWAATDELSFRAGAGRGFRAPSAKEFGFFFDHSSLGYRVRGNDALDPETSWGVNGDVETRPADGLRLRAGVFANWVKDLIDVELSPDQPGGGIDDFTYVNVGEARTFGAQADMGYRVTPALRTEVGYAYLWTRDDTRERPLPSRPPHTVLAAIVATLPGAFELTLRYRAVTDAFIDVDLRSPGFSTLDARIARALWPRSELYLGTLNILGAEKDPDRLGDRRPLVGRQVYLGLTIGLPASEE